MTGGVKAALSSVTGGARLNETEALSLFESNDLLAIGQAAHTIRMAKTGQDMVTYIIDRNINYTNYCVSGCEFCAFYRIDGDEDGYTLTQEELDRKIAETIELGGAQILMQGGLHPDLKIEWYEGTLRNIKQKYKIHIHAFSPPEIIHIANLNGIRIAETIARLKDAGLDSIPGGGAEILVDRVRDRLSPGKCSADEWIDVMREAHKQGLRTTATMMFGHIETLAERVESLKRIRDLQDETGGFTAFIPWPFQPDNTAMTAIRPSGGFDYLKTLAISRLYLDNIDNIQASWVTQGAKVGQMALLFGANDMGSTMIEENVVKAAGVSFNLSEKDIRQIIQSAGFTPKRRNIYYEILE